MILGIALATQTWTMVVGGDIMLNGVKPSPKVFSQVSTWTKSADIATANLEIPLTTSTTPTRRKTATELKAKTQFILKADPGHGRAIGEAGFDLVGLGNNHAMDYGYKGVQQMTSVLDKLGVDWCGAGRDADEAGRIVVVKARSGVKVAFVSFLAFRTDGGLGKCTPATSDSPGVSVLSFGAQLKAPQLRRLKEIVSKARSKADFVVAWLHWGTERKTVPDPWQVKLGRGFIEAGADCVLGAHPHVLQGAELFGGRPIFYSLGNLVSPRAGQTGLFRLTFEGRKLTKAEMLPCSISSGAVKPLSDSKRPSAVSAFARLCSQATAKYKHSKSKPIGF